MGAEMSLSSSIKISIASELQLFNYSFNSLIKNQKGISIVGVSSNYENFLVSCSKDKPDVGIIFFSSIYKSLTICKSIKQFCTPVPVIIFSQINNDKFAYLSFYAGAKGYLTINSSPEEVLKAIKQVYNSKNYFGPYINKKLSSHIENKYQLELERVFRMKDQRLSRREGEIFSLIGQGCTSKEIASDLKISKRTVDNLRARIIEKVGVSSLPALISIAVISSFF